MSSPPDPPDRRRIYLVGLMGSGKSTVGAALAERLGCRYVDNDDTIAELAGRSTVALAAVGGTLLHDWESRYAHYLRTLRPPVVAGIPASAADRGEDLRMLQQTGTLVYLRCDVDTLLARVTAGPPRPWLTGGLRPLISGMFDRRDPVLDAAAHVVVDATAPLERIVASVVGGEGVAAAG